MPSPIVIDGTKALITVDTRQGFFDVQVPPLDLTLGNFQTITVVDIGGLASVATPITITTVSGATFADGTTTRQIKTANGSLSFGQSAVNRYEIPTQIIRGNTSNDGSFIFFSTAHTTASTVQTVSSLAVLRNFAAGSIEFGGNPLFLRGFQPSSNQPFSELLHVSTIGLGTGLAEPPDFRANSLYVGTLYASTFIISTACEGSLLGAKVTEAASSFVDTVNFRGNNLQTLYASNSQLYFRGYQITGAMQTLGPALNAYVPDAYSNQYNPSPGISSLSSFIEDARILYTPNPGVSSMSTAFVQMMSQITGATLSTFNSNMGVTFSTNNVVPGLSTLSSLVSYGMSTFLEPATTSSTRLMMQRGMSTVVEARTTSSLLTTFTQGISTVFESGIPVLVPIVQGLLSTTACSSNVSSISSLLGYGVTELNRSGEISTLSTTINLGFFRNSGKVGISTLSTTLELGVLNVYSGPGISSLSTILEADLSNLNISAGVLSLSTAIQRGLSDLAFMGAGTSTLSSFIRLASTNIIEPGISSLFRDLRVAASTVNYVPGLSSLVTQFGTSWSTLGGPGLSTLSTVFGYGISTGTGITTPVVFGFSSLYASSLTLLSNASPVGYAELTINNGQFLFQGAPILYHQDNNSVNMSSISTYLMTVLTNANFTSTITAVSSIHNNIRTSSFLIASNIENMSTNTGIMTLIDRANPTNQYSFTYSNNNLYWNNRNVLDRVDPGLSSLSTLISYNFSSISTYLEQAGVISSGLSTLGADAPGLSSLSTMYSRTFKTIDFERGMSTPQWSISSLTVSTANMNLVTMISTLASTTTFSTMAVGLNAVSLNPNNSAAIVSSFSTQQILRDFIVPQMSTTLFGQELDADFVQTTHLVGPDFAIRTEFEPGYEFTASSLVVSTARTNYFTASTVFLRDLAAPYQATDDYRYTTHYPLYGLSNDLIYNSTHYVLHNNFTDASTVSLFVSSLSVERIYASSVTFTSKVQFDRLLTKPQSNVQPAFIAMRSVVSGGASNVTPMYSYDGINWSNANVSNCWLSNTSQTSHVRVAWNGEYAIAYSVDDTNTGGAAQSNAISYDGITWSNIPRYGAGITNVYIQAGIFWDGSKWWKICSGSLGSTYERGTYTSLDGINWTQHQWSLSDTASNTSIYFNGNNSGTANYTLSLVAYNGTTLVNYPIDANNANPGAIAFSDDLSNTRTLFQSNVICSRENAVYYNPYPWSDGYRWFFPNQKQNGTGEPASVVAIYPYRSNANGLDSNEPASNIAYKAATGVGFSFAKASYVVGAGHFNGEMHLAGRVVNATASNSVSETMFYSYNGLNWYKVPTDTNALCGSIRSIVYAQGKWVVAQTGTSANNNPSIFYSYDGLKFYPATGADITVSGTGSLGGGIEQIIYMSNIKPSLDLNGIKLYNQPGGISYQTPVSREQAITAFQSSFMLHNTLLFDTATTTSNAVMTKTLVGLCNLHPSTTLDLGGEATFHTQRMFLSSLYVLPNTNTVFENEQTLPLSSYNLYVHGSTYTQHLAVGGGTGTSFATRGMFPLIRQCYADQTRAADELNAVADSNCVLTPAIRNLSTGLQVYYKTGGNNYRFSMAGTGYFTGQHACICKDISGAVVSTVVSTVTTGRNGVKEYEYSTIFTDFTGYLLSSADDGYVSIYNNGQQLTACNAIQTIEALPVLSFTTLDKDPAVFGVVTNNANGQYADDGNYALDSDPNWGNQLWGRVRVNSIGEGALWVTNINGAIDNGDFLCGSVIPGHARKQDEPEMYNYTVAKATMSCDFNPSTTAYRCEPITYNGSTLFRAYIGCTYHCG